MPPSLPGSRELLHSLVSLPSVSSTQSELDQGNRAVIDILAQWLEELGFSIEIQALNDSGSKANLIATRGTGPGGPRQIWTGT